MELFLPARRSTSDAAFSTRSTAGSFGIANAASNSDIVEAPPHSDRPRSSTGCSEEASVSPDCVTRMVTVPVTASLISASNPALSFTSRSVTCRDAPPTSRSTLHVRGSKNGGSRR